ncbi:MAG TPA: choice-of-anchor Q domain-containing protein, partial [Polyangiaceae bacterium]|nr:choice-of-anchor Q domain-containing protein [Polyangiaceae bacterium]
LDIRGSEAGFPNAATGVRCENGSCVRVAGNVITGRGGTQATGVWLQQTGALVDRNTVRGGCSPTAVGVYSEDAWARLQNNRVFGFTQQDCGSATTTPGQSTGLRALTSTGLRELDVHSNFFDGGGQASTGATCTSRAVALGATSMPPTVPNGLFRNNIFRAGTCATRYGFEELVASADPRELANNDFDPATTPTALYFDEATTAVTTAAGIDALAGTTATATRSVDPQFTSYPTDLHLLAGSMCIDAGTTTGAPAYDMDGAARTGTPPDIGPDER